MRSTKRNKGDQADIDVGNGVTDNFPSQRPSYCDTLRGSQAHNFMGYGACGDEDDDVSDDDIVEEDEDIHSFAMGMARQEK